MSSSLVHPIGCQCYLCSNGVRPQPPLEAAVQRPDVQAPLREPKPIAIGDTVTIGGDIEGLLTAITFRSDGVTYEVTWWSERSVSSAWFAPFEIETDQAHATVESCNLRRAEGHGAA